MSKAKTDKASEELNRRDVFRIVGVTLLSADILAAQEATKSLNGGPNYVPKYLKPHEFKTLRYLPVGEAGRD